MPSLLLLTVLFLSFGCGGRVVDLDDRPFKAYCILSEAKIATCYGSSSYGCSLQYQNAPLCAVRCDGDGACSCLATGRTAELGDSLGSCTLCRVALKRGICSGP